MPKGISKTYGSKERSVVAKKVWKRKGHRNKVAKGQRKTFSTPEYHEKQSRAQTERWTPERRSQQSDALTNAWDEEGKRETWSQGIKDGNTKKVRAQKSNTRKNLMSNDPSYASQSLSKLLRQKEMTKPEKNLESLLQLLELPYEFVGNGKLMIGRYCPDFVRVDCKAIIEVYGYHHTRSQNKQHDKKRNAFIKRNGYRMLIVWASELDDIQSLVNKIKKFDKSVMDRLLESTIANKTRAPVKRQVKV